jgi:hypothetical protein
MLLSLRVKIELRYLGYKGKLSAFPPWREQTVAFPFHAQSPQRSRLLDDATGTRWEIGQLIVLDKKAATCS